MVDAERLYHARDDTRCGRRIRLEPFGAAAEKCEDLPHHHVQHGRIVVADPIGVGDGDIAGAHHVIGNALAGNHLERRQTFAVKLAD